MTFESQKSSYTVVSIIFNGVVNSCYTARLTDDLDGRSFTIILIREHEIIKKFMESQSRRDNFKEGNIIVDSFSYGSDYALVFPYRQERPLDKFFIGDIYTLEDIEEICTNILLACMSSSLPYPFLYLILEQGHINLSKDKSVFFSYDVDLKDFDDRRTEHDCTVKCAEILKTILSEKADQKNISYELISRKSENNGYSNFTELYRDLRISAVTGKKKGLIIRIKSFFRRNADLLLGILVWVCVILGVVALVMLLSHVVWGDLPLFRLFVNNFKIIGTESLQQ